MNQWKSAHAVATNKRTLEDAMDGADVFLGLSAKDTVSQDMVASMAENPLIFAMANPDPEITPEKIQQVRDDAIIATGRSDYPNQVNNVLGFPYIFRGALDVQATTINEDMKVAAAKAIAALAREDVPDEVAAAYAESRLQYGRNYIIAKPFDGRMISRVAPAVAQAAMDSGVAKRPIIDMDAYRNELSARLDPTASSLQLIFERVRANPMRIVFAEGEEEKIIRAAALWRANGYGTPVLVGREDHVSEVMSSVGLGSVQPLEVRNAETSEDTQRYVDYLYERRQRKGDLLRDCKRMINLDRNVFAACMVGLGDADAMVTGLTRSYWASLDRVSRVLEPAGWTACLRSYPDHHPGQDRVRRRQHHPPTTVARGVGGCRSPSRGPGPGPRPRTPGRDVILFDFWQPSWGPDGRGGARRGRHSRPAGGRFRIRRRDVGGRGLRSRTHASIPILPTVRTGERTHHAGFARRKYRLSVGQ